MTRSAEASPARTAEGTPLPTGLHVAIIMDGNGRWAASRRRARSAGHVEGARAVRGVVEHAAAPESGIRTLTLYAFSSDNWRRPPREVGRILRLLADYLATETPRCVERGVRLRIIGRRDRLASPLVRAMEAAEAATRGGESLDLRLAIDYSARDVMVRAAALASRRGAVAVSRTGLADLVARASGVGEAADVDLLIRTGGEQRLSDFLLWECAYAELYFTSVLWPDFGPTELDRALAEFARRERRFGALGRLPSTASA